MKYFSVIEPTSLELIRLFAEKRNLTDYVAAGYYTHPQEDYVLTSENPPVFVVSDGVTLDFRKLVEDNAKYPNPSPAGDVSRIFCEAIIQKAKEEFESFEEGTIKDVFKHANNAVAEYNAKTGKSDVAGNITGFYSATGSFVVFKDDKAYWASICDSFVAHFDKEMKLKFMSTGICEPYAVINGEERMAEHLEGGVLDLEAGDRMFVFTDGFEPYVRNQGFLKLFLDSGDIQGSIKDFSEKMVLRDVETYGHERSLIVIQH